MMDGSLRRFELEMVKMLFKNELCLKHTILSRTDTGEYLSHFLFFDPEAMTWTKDVNEVFCFRLHSDAECNARLILDRLHDPINRNVGLKNAKAVVC